MFVSSSSLLALIERLMRCICSLFTSALFFPLLLFATDSVVALSLQMSVEASADSKALAAAEKAFATRNANDWSGALELYQSALRLAPNHSKAWCWHFQCGYVLSHLNRHSESIEAYTQSIALNNKYAGTYCSRGGSCTAGLKRWLIATLR